VGADLVQAQIVAGMMTQGLKLAVGRTRPNNGRFSFPSGHASATFANAAVLQRHFGWKVGLPAYGVATYVAASRLQDNRHYASDVIFGAALGIVAGRTMTVGHGRGTFALAPVAVPGGAGVTFTRVP
jgi:membrane-associated phospholipid phosphatase